MKVVLHYKVSETVLREELRGNGKAGIESRSQEFDLFDLREDLREHIIAGLSAREMEKNETESFYLDEFFVCEHHTHFMHKFYVDDKRLTFDVAIPSKDQLESALAHHFFASEKMREEVEAKNAIINEQARVEREAEEREAQERKENARAQKIGWANEHGSERLRRGLEAGHSCDRLYQIERAAVEYPDYILDYEKCAGWKDRACPSLGALDERDAVLKVHPGAQVEIVWLTSEPQANTVESDEEEFDDDEGHFVEYEAIVVDDPNFTRRLVKTM